MTHFHLKQHKKDITNKRAAEGRMDGRNSAKEQRKVLQLQYTYVKQ